ncbi:MAG: PilZ domain-containing protein [Desulfosarcinaceae bacterium]|nr:PilZ domain-containing protein [Desulfosarcinaceae bacterium]
MVGLATASSDAQWNRSERRRGSRRRCFIPVDYVINDRVYRDFIDNLSQQGAFIRTRERLAVGTEICMTFSWIDALTPIKSKGIVVRNANSGMGVAFETPIFVQ